MSTAATTHRPVVGDTSIAHLGHRIFLLSHQLRNGCSPGSALPCVQPMGLRKSARVAAAAAAPAVAAASVGLLGIAGGGPGPGALVCGAALQSFGGAFSCLDWKRNRSPPRQPRSLAGYKLQRFGSICIVSCCLIEIGSFLFGTVQTTRQASLCLRPSSPRTPASTAAMRLLQMNHASINRSCTAGRRPMGVPAVRCALGRLRNTAFAAGADTPSTAAAPEPQPPVADGEISESNNAGSPQAGAAAPGSNQKKSGTNWVVSDSLLSVPLTIIGDDSALNWAVCQVSSMHAEWEGWS